MPWNGSGIFTRGYGSGGWASDAAAGTKIVASRHDTNDTDLATGINSCLAKNGENNPTANLPMNGYRHTGVGAGTARTDYLRIAELQDGTPCYLTSPAGTDTLTASAPYSLAAYATGQKFWFVAAGTNTGAVTLNINSLGAKSVTKYGTTALTAKDIVAGQVVTVVYDGTRFQMIGLNAARALIATAFRATSSAQTSMPSNNTKYNIALGSESYDYGSNFSSNQYTIPRAGLYLFIGNIYVNGTPANGATLVCYIRLDTGYYYIGVNYMPTSLNQTWMIGGCAMLSCSAGQTVGLTAEHNAGATMTAQDGSSCNLAGYFLGEVA